MIYVFLLIISLNTAFAIFFLKFILKLLLLLTSRVGVMTIIGNRLSDLRKNIGINQEELGKKLGLSKNAISAYERDINEPPDDIKVKLAKFFNVSLDYLLGIVDEPRPIYKTERRLYIRLPEDFPEELVKDAERYIQFLNSNLNKKKG